MTPQDKLDKLAESIWNYYYPNGGSVYPNYQSLSVLDKESLLSEARKVASFLDGTHDLILA